MGLGSPSNGAVAGDLPKAAVPARVSWRSRPPCSTGSVPQPAVEPLPPLDYAAREAPPVLVADSGLAPGKEDLARNEAAVAVRPLPVGHVDVDEAHAFGDRERARSIGAERLAHEIGPDRQG